MEMRRRGVELFYAGDELTMVDIILTASLVTDGKRREWIHST